MRFPSSRGLRVALLLLVLALVAAACGGDDGGADADAAAGDETGTDVTTESALESDPPEDGASVSEDATAASGSGEGAVVGYSQPIGRDPAIATIVQVLEQELNSYGHEFVTVDANLDPGKQISDIDSLTQQDIDLLIVNPIDATATQPALDRAREAGIQVLSQETEQAGPYETILKTTNFEAAQEMTSYLSEEVGDGGVLAIAGPPIAEVVIARNEGFDQGAADAGLNVLDTQVNEDITPETARAVTGTMQQQFGDQVEAIWAFNDTSALGAASAFTDGFSPVLIGMNGSQEAIDAINEGVMTATWDLQIVKYAKAMAWAADQALQGESLPEVINVEMQRIDESNIDEWQPPEELIGQDFEIELEERDGGTFLVTE